MCRPFIYDTAEQYFKVDDRKAEDRLALMRYSGRPYLGDDYLTPKPSPADRSRKWFGWGLSRPKNSKPKHSHKEHRA